MLTIDRLRALFSYFDTDSSGFISREDMKKAFAKSGKKLSDQEVALILEMHDFELNGFISFLEFTHLLFSQEPGSRAALPKGLLEDLSKATKPRMSIKKDPTPKARRSVKF